MLEAYKKLFLSLSLPLSPAAAASWLLLWIEEEEEEEEKTEEWIGERRRKGEHKKNPG